MRSLLACFILSLATSAYGQITDVTRGYLRDKGSIASVAISENGTVYSRFNKFPLVGRIDGTVTPNPDGGFSCRLILHPKRGAKPIVRGRYTVTRIEHPFTPPGGPAGLTYLELHRVFQGKCSDARMLKPHRRQFLFQGSDVQYPDLY